VFPSGWSENVSLCAAVAARGGGRAFHIRFQLPADRSIDRQDMRFSNFARRPAIACGIGVRREQYDRGNDRLANESQEFVTRVDMNEDKGHESRVPRRDQVVHIGI